MISFDSLICRYLNLYLSGLGFMYACLFLNVFLGRYSRKIESRLGWLLVYLLLTLFGFFFLRVL